MYWAIQLVIRTGAPNRGDPGDCAGSYTSLPLVPLPSAGGTDYSDAPTSGTSYGDATHTIVSGIQLGANIDGDAGSVASANADGDDTDGTDDEDGVTWPALQQGSIVAIPVTTTGAGGFLQAWIDWDGDGSFATSGDQIALDVQDGSDADFDGAADGIITLWAVVPGDATLSQTFARFRWSTTSGLNSTTLASDGEVEDYAITITADGGSPALQGCIGSSVSTHAFTVDPTSGTVATGAAGATFNSTISSVGFAAEAGTVGASGVQYNFPAAGAGQSGPNSN